MKIRFNWSDKAIRRLIELKKEGKSYREIAKIISAEFNAKLSRDAIKLKWQAISHFEEILFYELDYSLKHYETPILPEDDYLIFCDLHAPYFSLEWVMRALEYSRRFGIKKAISIGDFWDFSFASQYPPLGPQKDTLDSEAEAARPLLKTMARQFETIFLITGNHERRISNITESKIWAYHLLNYLIKQDVDKFVYIPYDKVYIGDKYLLVHPVSYSQISGNVAIRLAEKYHCNVINAHGHFIAKRYDRSGKYMGIDLGGLFDVSKIDYLNLRTTTHPHWNNGFGILKDGVFWLFDQNFKVFDKEDWKCLTEQARL